MTIAVLALLGAVVLGGAGFTVRGERVRNPLGAIGLVVVLAVAAALAWRAGRPGDGVSTAGLLLAVAAERFIIGTLASGLWAIGCVGVAVLLRS
jgi:hypothetical protein